MHSQPWKKVPGLTDFTLFLQNYKVYTVPLSRRSDIMALLAWFVWGWSFRNGDANHGHEWAVASLVKCNYSWNCMNSTHQYYTQETQLFDLFLVWPYWLAAMNLKIHLHFFNHLSFHPVLPPHLCMEDWPSAITLIPCAFFGCKD